MSPVTDGTVIHLFGGGYDVPARSLPFSKVFITFWGCRKGSLSVKYTRSPLKCCIFMTLLILTFCSHVYNKFGNKYFFGTQDDLGNALKVGIEKKIEDGFILI